MRPVVIMRSLGTIRPAGILRLIGFMRPIDILLPVEISKLTPNIRPIKIIRPVMCRSCFLFTFAEFFELFCDEDIMFQLCGVDIY
jgi:hypothetical protein